MTINTTKGRAVDSLKRAIGTVLIRSERDRSGQNLGKNSLNTPKQFPYYGSDDETMPEEPMTLCIAAECQHEGCPAIVLCCDWRGQRGTEFRELVGSDDVDKIRDIFGVEASALLAGAETDADMLLTACEPAIRKYCGTPVNSDSDIVISTFIDELKEVAERRKTNLIEHCVKMSLGLDYAVLRATPNVNLTTLDEEVYDAIRNLNLQADVIIAVFSDESVILRLDRFGSVHWESNYSVIGEGADIALAFLCQQPWDLGGSSNPPTSGPSTAMTLMQCLYRVYEAKKAAEKNRSVGEATAFSVLIRGKGRFEISTTCRDKLYNAFKRKNRVPKLKFDASFLEPEKDADKSSS